MPFYFVLCSLTKHWNISRPISRGLGWGGRAAVPHAPAYTGENRRTMPWIALSPGPWVGHSVAANHLPFSFSSWYYCLHVCSILVMLLLPVKKSQRRKSTQENVQLSRAKKFDERENSLGQNSFSTMNNVCNQNQDTGSRHSSLTQ